MTATYDLQSNSIKELPQMEKPEMEKYWWMFKYDEDMEKYNAHLSTLRTIPCSPECKGLWEDGQVLEEGVDYEVRKISKYQRPVGQEYHRAAAYKNKMDLPEPLRSTIAAYPIISYTSAPCYWIKASERLPKYLGEPRIVKIDGMPSAGNFEKDENGNLCFYVTWGHEWCVQKDKFSGIEWLEETTVPVKSEDDLWEEALSFLVNNPALNYPSQIKELKSKYIITKR